MSSPLCDMDGDCEDCGDRQASGSGSRSEDMLRRAQRPSISSGR